MYTVTIEVGQNLSKVVLQLLGRSLAPVERSDLAPFLVTYLCQHIAQRNVLAIGEHGNICQTRHTVSGEGRLALVGFIKSLNDKIHFTTAYQLVKTWTPCN